MWRTAVIVGFLGTLGTVLALSPLNPVWKSRSIGSELREFLDKQVRDESPTDGKSKPVALGKAWLVVDYGLIICYTILFVSLCEMGSAAWSESSNSTLRWFILMGWFFVPVVDFVENTALWVLLSGRSDTVVVNIAVVARSLKWWVPAPWALFGIATALFRFLKES